MINNIQFTSIPKYHTYVNNIDDAKTVLTEILSGFIGKPYNVNIESAKRFQNELHGLLVPYFDDEIIVTRKFIDENENYFFHNKLYPQIILTVEFKLPNSTCTHTATVTIE